MEPFVFQQFDSLCKAEVAFFIARAFINVSNFEYIYLNLKYEFQCYTGTESELCAFKYNICAPDVSTLSFQT